MVLSICNTQVASIPRESDAIRSSTHSRACRPRSNGARHAGRHGPIALVDEGELVVFIMPPDRGRDVLHAKVRSGIEEVKSRGAFIIAVAEQGDRDDERYADVMFRRPECPTLMSRSSTWSHCSCSPWIWPRSRGMTWTSRAISPNPSRLSDAMAKDER